MMKLKNVHTFESFIAEAVEKFDSKMDSFDVAIVEGKMKEIFTMAQEADSYEAFKKEVMKAHPTLKQDASLDEWLKDVFDSAQEMDESMKYKAGDKIKWSSPKGIVDDVITGVNGIYYKLKSGGEIPYQSIVE
jgi:hypothetical protein